MCRVGFNVYRRKLRCLPIIAMHPNLWRIPWLGSSAASHVIKWRVINGLCRQKFCGVLVSFHLKSRNFQARRRGAGESIHSFSKLGFNDDFNELREECKKKKIDTRTHEKVSMRKQLWGHVCRGEYFIRERHWQQQLNQFRLIGVVYVHEVSMTEIHLLFGWQFENKPHMNEGTDLTSLVQR